MTGRGGGQLAILPACVFLLDSTVSPPVTTPQHCQATGASGWARQGATQETGNHEKERKPWGVKGGSGHDVQQLPLLVWENNRKRKWKFVFSVPITSPYTKEDVSPTYLLFSPPPNTHTSPLLLSQ